MGNLHGLDLSGVEFHREHDLKSGGIFKVTNRGEKLVTIELAAEVKIRDDESAYVESLMVEALVHPESEGQPDCDLIAIAFLVLQRYYHKDTTVETQFQSDSPSTEDPTVLVTMHMRYRKLSN